MALSPRGPVLQSRDMSTETVNELMTTSRHRSVLRDAMVELESSVSGPSAAPGWRENVASALTHLGQALEAHIAEAESPGGHLSTILDTEPHLTAAVTGILDSHAALRARLASAVAAVEDAAPDSRLIRRRVSLLLWSLIRHRQEGAELIYDAYNVDIGTGD